MLYLIGGRGFSPTRRYPLEGGFCPGDYVQGDFVRFSATPRAVKTEAVEPAAATIISPASADRCVVACSYDRTQVYETGRTASVGECCSRRSRRRRNRRLLTAVRRSSQLIDDNLFLPGPHR